MTGQSLPVEQETETVFYQRLLRPAAEEAKQTAPLLTIPMKT